MEVEEALEILGLDPGVDQRTAKRAYLRQVKLHKPERDPQGFRRVREAYETVQQDLMMQQAYGEWAQSEADGTEPGEAEAPAPGVDPLAAGFDGSPMGAALADEGDASPDGSDDVAALARLRTAFAAHRPSDDEADTPRLMEFHDRADALGDDAPVDAYIDIYREAVEALPRSEAAVTMLHIHLMDAGKPKAARRAIREAVARGLGGLFETLVLEHASGLDEAELKRAARDDSTSVKMAAAVEWVRRGETQRGLRALRREFAALSPDVEWIQAYYPIEAIRLLCANGAFEEAGRLRKSFSSFMRERGIERVMLGGDDEARWAALTELINSARFLPPGFAQAVAQDLRDPDVDPISVRRASLDLDDRERNDVARVLQKFAPSLWTLYEDVLPVSVYAERPSPGFSWQPGSGLPAAGLIFGLWFAVRACMGIQHATSDDTPTFRPPAAINLPREQPPETRTDTDEPTEAALLAETATFEPEDLTDARSLQSELRVLTVGAGEDPPDVAATFVTGDCTRMQDSVDALNGWLSVAPRLDAVQLVADRLISIHVRACTLPFPAADPQDEP